MNKIKTRLASEQGFTLIELLVVIVILGILVAIAVPAYLSFRGNAQDAAAKSNVRSAIPAAEGFYQSNSTYTGMNATALQQIAPGVSITHVVVSTDGNAYCLDAVNGTSAHEAYYIGGDQHISSSTTGFGTDTGVLSSVTQGKACANVVSG